MVAKILNHKLCLQTYIYQFNLYTFLCQFQARTWISNIICHGLFYVYRIDLRWEMIVPFCWYWWNCWPSLLKLFFYNTKLVYHLLNLLVCCSGDDLVLYDKVWCLLNSQLMLTWHNFLSLIDTARLIHLIYYL